MTRQEAFRANERAVAPFLGGDESERIQIVCECLNRACDATISVQLADYLLLRATPEDFAVAEGHEQPPRDVVVDVSAAYITVEDQDLVPPHLKWARFVKPS